jgi:hypothetical protein
MPDEYYISNAKERWLAGVDERRKQYDDEDRKKREVAQRFSMLGLNPGHYDTADQMLAAANERIGNLNSNQAPGRQAMWDKGEGRMPDNAPEAPQRSIRRPFNMQAYSGANSMNPALMAQQVSSAQARHLGGMIDDVQDAIQDENDSRVAQMREQRRMAHEREMEAMRQEALLQRLAIEQREREKDRILQKQLRTGVTTRRLVNGRWEDV